MFGQAHLKMRLTLPHSEKNVWIADWHYSFNSLFQPSTNVSLVDLMVSSNHPPKL